jgi:hypothetical protein
MNKYLLSIYQPDGGVPPPDMLAKIMADVGALQEEMKAAAANLDFERAAAIRDDIKRLRNPELGLPRPARRA